MSGLGLILGAGLAGGMQGLGEGATKSLQMSQEAQQKEDLVNLQAQLEMAKDERIAEINHGYRTQENQQIFEHSDTQADKQRAFDAEQAGFKRAGDLDVVHAQGTNSLAVADKEGGYRVQEANIAAASADRRTDAEKNRLSQFTGGDGLVWNYNSSSGLLTPATDGKGNQLVGLKNVPQAILEQVHSYQEEQKTFGQTQPDRATAAGDAIKQLLAPYMPNGGAGPRIDPSKFPPQLQAQLPLLLQNPNDPQTLANFDAAAAKYGVGGQGTGAAVAKLLAGATPVATPAAPVTPAATTAGAAPDGTPPLPGDTSLPAGGAPPLPGGNDNPLPVGNPPQGPAAGLIQAAAAAPVAPAPAPAAAAAAAPAAPAAPAAGAQTTQGTAPTMQGTVPYVQPSPAVTASRQGAKGIIVSHFVPRGPVAVLPAAGYQPDTENHFVSRVAGTSGTTKGNPY